MVRDVQSGGLHHIPCQCEGLAIRRIAVRFQSAGYSRPSA
jgi:hypothetical protein